MSKILIPLPEDLDQVLQSMIKRAPDKGVELLGAGLEAPPTELYQQWQALRISTSRFAELLDISPWELTDLLRARGLKITNLPGAAISDASFHRYGQLGWPILTFPANQPPELLKAQIDTYRRVYCEHGYDPSRMRIGLTMFTYVAEDAGEAHATFERGMAHYFGFLHRITTEAEAVQHGVYESLPTTARLSGSPAQVVQRLRELIADFGVTDIVNVTQFRGYLTHEQVLGSIRLFAERVMPAFQPVTAS